MALQGAFVGRPAQVRAPVPRLGCGEWIGAGWAPGRRTRRRTSPGSSGPASAERCAPAAQMGRCARGKLTRASSSRASWSSVPARRPPGSTAANHTQTPNAPPRPDRRSGATSPAPSPPGELARPRSDETRSRAAFSRPAPTQPPPPHQRGAAARSLATTRATPHSRCTATDAGATPPARQGLAPAPAVPVPSPSAHCCMGTTTRPPRACARLDQDPPPR